MNDDFNVDGRRVFITAGVKCTTALLAINVDTSLWTVETDTDPSRRVMSDDDECYVPVAPCVAQHPYRAAVDGYVDPGTYTQHVRIDLVLPEAPGSPVPVVPGVDPFVSWDPGCLPNDVPPTSLTCQFDMPVVVL